MNLWKIAVVVIVGGLTYLLLSRLRFVGPAQPMAVDGGETPSPRGKIPVFVVQAPGPVRVVTPPERGPVQVWA